MPLETVDLHRNAVHPGQHLLVHDFVNVPNAEAALQSQRDALDIVGDLVERVAHHEDRDVVALVELPNEAEDLCR